MKKLTKLVSAIVFASALALVGCANPSSGEPTVKSFGPGDVTIPDNFKASDGAKYVETKDDFDKVMKEIGPVVGIVVEGSQALSSDAIMQYVENNQIGAEAEKKQTDLEAEFAKAVAANKDFNDSIEATFKDIKSENKPYGSLIVKSVKQKLSMKYTAATSEKDINMETNIITDFDITDVSKLVSIFEYSNINANMVKTMKYSISTYSKAKPNSKPSTYSDKGNAVLLFDTGTYKGILLLKNNVAWNSDTNSSSQEYTFYDLKGNKTLDTITLPEAK